RLERGVGPSVPGLLVHREGSRVTAAARLVAGVGGLLLRRGRAGLAVLLRPGEVQPGNVAIVVGDDLLHRRVLGERSLHGDEADGEGPRLERGGLDLGVQLLAALHQLVLARIEQLLALRGEARSSQLLPEELHPLLLGVELTLDVALTTGELQRAAVETGARVDAKQRPSTALDLRDRD